MTGLTGLNQAQFGLAGERLYRQGHTIITPFDLNVSAGTYRQQMKRDLVAICGKADALYMLEGWEHSPGARAEHAVAVAIKLPIRYEAS